MGLLREGEWANIAFTRIFNMLHLHFWGVFQVFRSDRAFRFTVCTEWYIYGLTLMNISRRRLTWFFFLLLPFES
jgi:hypothetical protein